MRCSGCGAENVSDRRFCHVAAADHLRKGVAALDHDAGRTLLRFGGLALSFVASFTAWTLAELGEFAESEAVGLMAFELAMKANHAYSVSIASFGLAQGWIRQGRFADAIRVLEQGCEQTKLHTIEAAVDQVVSRLIYAYSRTGQLEEARKLEQTMSPELTRFSFLSSTHFSLAAMGFESDRIDATVQAAREVHQTAMQRGERRNVAWLEHLLGDLAMASNPTDTSAAAGHYRAAATIADQLGMRLLAMECHFGLAAVARRAGRENEAKSEFQSALELAEEMGILSAANKARQQLQTTVVSQ